MLTGSATFLRAVVTLVVAAALSAALLAFSPAPVARAASGCADNTGLNVVVDYKDGRSPEVRCVENWKGGSGLDAFQGAGFNLIGVGGSLAFICKIEGFPADENCDTYPDDGFWNYWIASDGSWGQSGLGVTSAKAQAGQWHGFSYSTADSAAQNPQPSVSPKVPPKPKKDDSSSKGDSSGGNSKDSGGSKSSGKNNSSDKGTSKPESGSSSASETGSAPSATGSENGSPNAESEDESEKSDEDSSDASQESEPEPPAPITETATEAPHAPPESDSHNNSDSSDATAQQNRAGSEGSGPPIGTLVAGGVIILLAVVAILRHRASNRPKSE